MTRLSICIATLNRAAFIRATLESIIEQLVSHVEIIVVDGASTDGTEQIVTDLFARHRHCHYYRLEEKGGVDADYCRAVDLANGEFCWLMTDDDIVKPNAVETILRNLKVSVDLVVLNGEWAYADLSVIYNQQKMRIASDRIFKASQQGELLAACGEMLSFIGSVVIRKSVWDSRDKQRYFGTEFVHVGVIFQSGLVGDAIALSRPLLTVRYGNSQWVSRGFAIWTLRWPRLIWSFKHLPAASRRVVTPEQPWKSFVGLCAMKARGWYTMKEYREFLENEEMSLPTRFQALLIALFPNVLFNFLVSLVAAVIFSTPKGIHLELRQSPYYFRRRWFGH